VPLTCQDRYKNCGNMDDGCGHLVWCGDCTTGNDTCGGGGIPNLCGCTPRSCAQIPGACGPLDNGCGGTITCDCSAPNSCGGGGTAGACGCTPRDCGADCGEVYDGCGHMLSCGACPGGATPAPLPLRLMAANITSGNLQSYDPGEGIRIFQALKPDVVMIQEFNYHQNTADDYRSFVDQVCGPTCAWSAGTAGAGRLPNGVISRWPIVETGFWDDPGVDNRDLDWARIDLPAAKDLFVVSVHLHTSPAGDQVAAAQVIAREITQYRAAHPDCCWYVVGGDFNGPAAVSSSGFGSYAGQPVFYVEGPHPVGPDGQIETNATGSKQLDFVLLDLALHAFQVPSVFTSTNGTAPLTYVNGLVLRADAFTQAVLDTFFPPAQTSDSTASGMQHMGVVKSVRLPR
jgi:endonuclease/exonuclease/phosphatase family metal-dependent hydrolase